MITRRGFLAALPGVGVLAALVARGRRLWEAVGDSTLREHPTWALSKERGLWGDMYVFRIGPLEPGRPYRVRLRWPNEHGDVDAFTERTLPVTSSSRYVSIPTMAPPPEIISAEPV